MLIVMTKARLRLVEVHTILKKQANLVVFLRNHFLMSIPNKPKFQAQLSTKAYTIRRIGKP